MITNISEYRPNNTAANGLQGRIGAVDLAGQADGNSVELLFEVRRPHSCPDADRIPSYATPVQPAS